MKTFCYGIFLWSVLSACLSEKSKEQATEYYLAGENEKYWTNIPEYPIKRYRGRLFKRNGTYVQWATSFSETGQRFIIPAFHKTTWKLKNDSLIIDGMGVNFTIEYINDDILVLNNLSAKEILVYLKSEDQHTQPIRDTTAGAWGHTPKTLRP